MTKTQSEPIRHTLRRVRIILLRLGWLLGVEEPSAAPDETLSEDQFKIVEELVKRYQTPPKPHLTVFHYMFAIGASIMIFLFMYSQTARLEKHILMYDASIASLDQRLEALESAVGLSSTRSVDTLLADYSFDLYPYTKTKSTHRVKVSFSAIPNVWNKENTGYLCISGGTEPIRTPCRWDGTRLTADITLDVANGYGISFAIEHADESQEQQLLESKIISQLASACSIPLWAEYGSFSYRNGAVILTDCTASLSLPQIYHSVSAIPNVTDCEFRLYRKQKNGSEDQMFRSDLLKYLEHGISAEYQYKITPQTVRFENVDIRGCSHLQLTLYVKLSSGVEGEIPINTFLPDGKGGLTD